MPIINLVNIKNGSKVGSTLTAQTDTAFKQEAE